MVTAEDLFLNSQIDPADFGDKIVDPEDEAADQLAAAIEHIDDKILPGAISEVAVPYARVAEGYELPLPETVLKARYPRYDSSQCTALNTQLTSLYDSAVESYAKAEINKQVATNAKSYDEDADTDRKTADAKLKKLLEGVADILLGVPDEVSDLGTSRPNPSLAVSTTFVW